jgi:hypothetical protein
LLFLQAGNAITGPGTSGMRSTLLDSTSQKTSPTVAALNFFTQFADPRKQTYTWSRSLDTSTNLFLSNSIRILLQKIQTSILM